MQSLSRHRAVIAKILKDEAAVGDIFSRRRERDRSTDFLQGQVFPPEAADD